MSEDKIKRVCLTFPEQKKLHDLLLSWMGTEKIENKRMADIVDAVNAELDIDKIISGTHIKGLRDACDDLEWKQNRVKKANKRWEKLLVIEVDKMLRHQAELHDEDVDKLCAELHAVRIRLSKLEANQLGFALAPTAR